MITLDVLKEFGANTDEGMERCLHEEDFYLSLIPPALDREGFEKIENSIKAGKLREAFEAAHALKGVLGNLALTPILKPVSEMTELLRVQTETDYEPMIQTMWEQRDKLAAYI